LSTSLQHRSRWRHRGRLLTALAIATLVIGVIIFVLIRRGALPWPNPKLEKVELGPLSAWVSGLVSAIALIIAISSFRNQADRGEKDQVRGVSAWVHPLARNDTTLSTRGLDPNSPGVYVILQNLTESPVFDVRLTVSNVAKQEPMALRSEHVAWPPQASRAWPLNVPQENEEQRWAIVQKARLTLEFTDALGRQWRQQIEPRRGR
jgi:hypothetical protein